MKYYIVVKMNEPDMLVQIRLYLKNNDKKKRVPTGYVLNYITHVKF